jgi:hypothetical protein
MTQTVDRVLNLRGRVLPIAERIDRARCEDVSGLVS